ncbi:MAG: C4-dicarboxylate ABC transporter, partial [Paracoccaceae bacterium]|nr:C4-dicarboxylate ABC transporter [Paracoccaceae bacterium]
MFTSLTRRALISMVTAATIVGGAGAAIAQDKIKLRLSAVSSDTDQRAIALLEKFAPAVAGIADFEP